MIDQEQLLTLTESYLKSLILSISDTLTADFDNFAPFNELGIDSFYVLKLIKLLESDFGTLPKTLLFEHFNIHDLANYFTDKHCQTLTDKFTGQLNDVVVHKAPLEVKQPAVVVTAQVSQQVQPQVSQQKQPIMILETAAFAHPELKTLVQGLFDQYKNEGSVSRGTRNIAPNLFIGSEKRGFFNYGRSKNIIVAYAYTGPMDYFGQIAVEMFDYCKAHDFELSILGDEDINAVGDIACHSTPFGVVQRILNIKDFTLKGGSMRRLRYQVAKFEKVGICRTQEYQCGSLPKIDQDIAQIIDQWCDARSMVNPLIHVVKDEILAGTLKGEHRLFLTYLDDQLQNVILVSKMISAASGFDGYLMDLEFYGKEMPLGGLEYAITQIIDILAKEGCNLLSMGGTYGCKLESGNNADPKLDKVLDELREQNLFNDEGNLQFKNKFRPENRTIYLCRAVGRSDAHNIIDIIMMIADPDKMQTPDTENHTLGKLSEVKPVEAKPIEAMPVQTIATQTITVDSSTVVIEGEKRSAILADNGFNPLNIIDEHLEFDGKTDSWAQLSLATITKQMQLLQSQLQQPANLDNNLRNIFPFKHFVLTTSGRTSEQIFYKAWANKGKVVQNLMFPTAIYHQIDNGFTPWEMPCAELFDLSSSMRFKSNLNVQALKEALTQDAGSIAFVCIEISDNASGGQPVSIENIKQIKALLAQYDIALVMDGTRVVENAQFVIEHESGYADKDLWAVVKEIFSYADAVITSLAKDFCVNKGGLVATNDPVLFERLKACNHQLATTLDVIDKKCIALSMQNTQYIQTQVLRRKQWVAFIADTLQQNNIPFVGPVGAHCLLFDVKQMEPFNRFENPAASFVAWLYINSGIRAGAHSVGMQKNSAINDLVRLAVPVGLKRQQIEQMTAKLVNAFTHLVNIPELVLEGDPADAVGNIHANYRLQQYHNASSGVVDKPAEKATSTATSTDKSTAQSKPVQQNNDIAIVGMSGRYPGAKNLEQLWTNLTEGVDSVTSLPQSRAEQRAQEGAFKDYRGGFIDDVDKFDSLFFNISPREAEILDPQERLFLEVAYEAIEDAGYYPESLSDDEGNRKIGVFVGAVWTMYQLIGVENKLAENAVNPNSFLWSVANRVSYWMNLCGPSLTLDTACSSSLTALYLACESIIKGECAGAIVGGVNLDLHQYKYDINSTGGALSADGFCRTFGAGANGYVAGEGVGALFLKPLSQAIADKDNIQGVIKSAVVNHGGRTSGYTVPNPKSHTELICAALKKANVDARSMGYIEAHGTGTELGDPIEIAGLSNAFEQDKVDNQSCAVGSVKTNIGHLEAAAGVVGMSKVLLQMKHQQLVPSLHSATLNEFIDFENSPFYVQQSLQPWTGQKVDGVGYPLRAGISSFGAGGANAHVIVEQYPVQQSSEQPLGSVLIFPLSARNEEQLLQSVIRLKAFVEQDIMLDEASQQAIENIAFTLQVGKKSFDHRLVIITDNKKILIEKLQCFVDGKSDSQILTGHIKNAQGFTRLLNRKEKAEFVKMFSASRDPNKLAQLWLDGLMSDWQGIATSNTASRISLPTYPFADKRHWMKGTSKKIGTGVSSQNLHPLLDQNESTFEYQRFNKTFHYEEFFLGDHIVSGVPTLPGVAYLELARVAGEAAAATKVRKIKNILWLSPLTVSQDEPNQTFIDLKPQGDMVKFEVFSNNNDNKQIYSQGSLCYATAQDLEAPDEYIDLEALRGRCTKVMDGDAAYPLFKKLGLHYGPSFQVISEVFKNDSEVFGVLKVPQVRQGDFAQQLLHPSILDAAMQVGVVAQLGEEHGQMMVPYSIGEVEILHPLELECYSYVTKADSDKGGKVSRENLLILNSQGKVLVRIHESVGVPIQAVHEKPKQDKITSDDENYELLYYTHEWQESPLQTQADIANAQGTILLFDHNEELRDLYRARLDKNGKGAEQVVLVLPGQVYEELANNAYRINPIDPQDHHRLFASLQQKQWSIGKICYHWPLGALSGDSIEQKSAQLKASLDNGVYGFLGLCQAIIAHKLVKDIQLLYLYGDTSRSPQPHNDAINGFVKSLQLENSKLRCKVVEICQQQTDSNQVLDIVLSELQAQPKEQMTVRYDAQTRFIRQLKQFERPVSDSNQDSSLKQQGVYIITGGAGGLGLIFAEYLAKTCKAKLVLTGRSQLSAEQQGKLDALSEMGAQVLYVAADVSNYNDAKRLISKTKSRFGQINGIIHSAGVLRDSLVRNKTNAQMTDVFAAKIYGTQYLDELTKTESLDLFVLFSSLAAIGGNAGQCDYAFANHYMDAFAAAREQRAANGEKLGKTLSLNWSLWADGAMQLDEQTEQFFKKHLGIKPLDTAVGLEAFVTGITGDKSQLVVLEAEQEKIELAWGLRKPQEPVVAVAQAQIAKIDVAATEIATNTDSSNGELLKDVQEQLTDIVIDFLMLERSDIDLESILLDLGFDSIGLASYADAVNAIYKTELTPVLFFEYPNIMGIAQHIVDEHGANAQNAHQSSTPINVAASMAPPIAQIPAELHKEPALFAVNKGWSPVDAGNIATAQKDDNEVSIKRRFVQRPIAVVGMSGVMPQSEDLEEFWNNLKNGCNMVTDIPADRWVWQDFDGDPVKEKNKSYSRWGGFMKQVDQFDPMFFGITPREAQMMDPQQRILLQTAYHAIEDSGQKVSDLAGSKTGVFVGVSAKDYVDVMVDNEMELDGYSASGTSHSILANRISYLLDLRGPSAPMDTACSSSLVALHRALESIHTGSSDMAIVGGVQVMLTPAAHIALSSAGMLSADGKCKTFDKDANGYVRGEGCGAIFLKPLDMAEADGNHIHAIIKSTAENHGGKVTMLTAPNPNAQAQLLIEAYEKAEIDPTTVGYIECHGTGTSLGDPIEIQALKKAFTQLYKNHGKDQPTVPHCGLSAVKTNVGHLEPAAGMAGLLKALLSIKNQTIPALLHFENTNPYVDLTNTPFYIVDKTTPWQAPVDNQGNTLPRRAGVSSFGWGGANAHVVVEEYIPRVQSSSTEGPKVIVLSAKNEDRLKAYAQLMLRHVQNYPVNLDDFAYTLQVGRDVMKQRVGFVVHTVDELIEKFTAFVSGDDKVKGIYSAQLDKKKQQLDVLYEDDDIKNTVIDKLITTGKYQKLLGLWVKGLDFDWFRLHPGVHRQRLSLPTYPFAPERHWLDIPDKPKRIAPAKESVKAVGDLLATPVWQPVKASLASGKTKAFTKRLIFTCDMPQIEGQQIEALIPQSQCLVLAADQQTIAQRYSDYSVRCFELIQSIIKQKTKGKILIQIVMANTGDQTLYAGLSGLLKTVSLEHPKLQGQVILSAPDIDESALVAQLQDNQSNPLDGMIRYNDGIRHVLSWQAMPADNNPPVAFKERGVYLITGGMGGLGLLFAKEILQHCASAKVILTGRSALSAKKQTQLDKLFAQDKRVEYQQLDITNAQQVQQSIDSIVTKHQQLNGIIHSAGMISDNFILKKTTEQFSQVLDPKVTGTYNLDQASQAIGLDFMVLFSSVSGAMGNLGQACYATANGFMDQFATWRNGQIEQKQRQGHTLSINWPLWLEGGMTIDQASRQMLLQATGMQPLETATGMKAFYRSLDSGQAQTVIMQGDLNRIEQFFSSGFQGKPAGSSPSRPEQTSGTNSSDSITNVEKLMALLKADLQKFQQGVN